MPYYFQTLEEMERSPVPIACHATDYAPGSSTGTHRHPFHHQLIHAVHGVMLVASEGGQWIVPPTRGIWMPAGTEHQVGLVAIGKSQTQFVHWREI